MVVMKRESRMDRKSDRKRSTRGFSKEGPIRKAVKGW